MPERAPRYPCPVCLGATMGKIRIGVQAPLEIDHCGRCGGVWLEHGEVPRLRTFAPAALWSRIGRRMAVAVTPCHDCHAPLDRDQAACPACGWKNVIDCPVCDRPMQRETREGVTLDVCRACKGVWIDHRELDAVWSLQVSLAVARRPAAGLSPNDATAGDVLLDVLIYAPDVAIHGTAHAVAGIAEVAAHVPDLVAAAPETAVAVVQVAGEAAGGVFEVIAGILEALFGILDF